MAKNVDFSTSSSVSPTCTFLSKSLGPAGKRIWPQFSTRLFPCRTTFLSTLGTVVARNCSPRWPLPTLAMSLAVKKGFFNLYYLQQQQLASSLLTPGGSMALAHPFLCEHDTTCTRASWGQGCVEILPKKIVTQMLRKWNFVFHKKVDGAMTSILLNYANFIL